MTAGADIRGILAALAAELGRAEAAAAAAEDAAGHLVAASGAAVPGLQGFDRLRQVLADLAAFTRSLAESAAGTADPVRALASVTGREVAARLAGLEPPAGEDELWDA